VRMGKAKNVRSGSRTALQHGLEKVRFPLLTCSPLPSPAIVNAQRAVDCLRPYPHQQSRSGIDLSSASLIQVLRGSRIPKATLRRDS
jgi:hypothetical protein